MSSIFSVRSLSVYIFDNNIHIWYFLRFLSIILQFYWMSTDFNLWISFYLIWANRTIVLIGLTVIFSLPCLSLSLSSMYLFLAHSLHLINSLFYFLGNFFNNYIRVHHFSIPCIICLIHQLIKKNIDRSFLFHSWSSVWFFLYLRGHFWQSSLCPHTFNSFFYILISLIFVTFVSLLSELV